MTCVGVIQYRYRESVRNIRKEKRYSNLNCLQMACPVDGTAGTVVCRYKCCPSVNPEIGRREMLLYSLE
jgi:hypothetical protein